MNAKIRQQLARRKRRIQRRLDNTNRTVASARMDGAATGRESCTRGGTGRVPAGPGTAAF